MLYKEIIDQGAYAVIEHYQGKEGLVALTTREMMNAIESLAGKEAASSARSLGLDRLHEFLNPDLVPSLQSILDEQLKAPLLRLTNAFAQSQLGLSDFYLDLKVITRIKFPFEAARKSKLSYLDYSKANGRTTFHKPAAETMGYHRYLPFPAWNHGPHADSWFGHSYDGINLWWAVAGVTKESGMTFYPDYVGDKLPTIDEPPYLTKDHQLPKPVFFNLNPGDVIAFNSDTLHGSRLNTSNRTRVSLSTRINPSAPRFNLEQFRHVQYWVNSGDLENMLNYALPTGEQSHRADSTFNAGSNPYITVFKKEDCGDGSTCKKSLDVKIQEVVYESWVDGKVKLPRLGKGQRITVVVGAERIVVAYTSDGLRALAGVCPHVGYHLGGHDDNRVYCNGHGLAFDWNTGESGCSLYKVKAYAIVKQDDVMYLTRNDKKPPASRSSPGG